MVSVVWVGGLVGISRYYSAVAIVVDVCEEVAQDAGHLDRGERRCVAAFLWDAVAGAQVVARAAREHARALLAGRALNALVAGAIVATRSAVLDVAVGPDAAVAGAGRRAGGVA